MRYQSPLRYPGGKAGLAPFLENVITRNNLSGCVYYEPYAGGAGAALSLLRKDVVSVLHLNDADYRVAAFWESVLKDSERFAEKIRAIPLTIEEWYRQHKICSKPQRHTKFDVGFAAFFMNRCNRSGVLTGAGPIGGYKQDGKWRIDVRFNREALIERVLAIAHMKDRIYISCKDAIVFLKKQLPVGRGRERVFVYLDPPYVNNGQRLYLNAYKPEDHSQLAHYLEGQKVLTWIVSYDDSDLVRKLYAQHNIWQLPLQYSLQDKKTASELIIAPQHVGTPRAYKLHGNDRILKTLN
ncbi:MAG: DNA adenine methylase [Nitrospira sp.]|nr:DNA adenine methylase [Nitrospira sp.]